MRQKPKPCDVVFLFLQKLAPVIVSPDKSENEAHINAASCLPTTASFLRFLPPLASHPPSAFPVCPEVIFVGIVAELHCVMTTQSWDFMMQSMSKISKEQKRAFSKCSRYGRGAVTCGEYVTIRLGED